MKQLIFTDYPSTQGKDIVTFSPTAQSMFEQIKDELKKKDSIELYIGRISDTGINISSSTTNFFSVTIPEKNQLKASFLSDILGHGGEKIISEKIIRFDNPFGEIPILSGYHEMPKFFLVGDELKAYKSFIDEVRQELEKEIGNPVRLSYKNDDGSFSIVEGYVKEINKGNIFMTDYKEILVVENRTSRVEDVSRNKNHRFVSEKGYLCKISPGFFSKGNFDDDEVFGEDACWNFVLPQQGNVAV